MISTALELQEPLRYIYRNTTNEEFGRIFPSLSEWHTLQQLEKIFLVLVKPVIRLQSEYYTNINKALLFVYSIYNKLEALIEEFNLEAVEEPDIVSNCYYYFIILVY